MKHISIITWYSSGNYGTTLQAFALHRKLQDLGYKVSILRELEFNNKRKIITKYFLRKLGLLEYSKKRKFSSNQKGLNIYNFIRQNINIKEVFTNKELKQYVSKTDVFITGSDQIWNAWFCFNPFYFLDFAGDKKRIAYATSIGTKSFPKKYEKEIKSLLSKFHRIAVRENSAVDLINNILGNNSCIQVADPTFLLTRDEWRDISSKAEIRITVPEQYILCYFIGNNESYQKQLEDVRRKIGIENVIIIPSLENPSFSIEDAIIYNEAGPYEFVNLIQNASLVCTDSFHATTISIISLVKFVEFKRFNDNDLKSQNSRIYDLLGHYNLSHLLYDENNNWHESVDFRKIEETINHDREKSVNYLIESIEN